MGTIAQDLRFGFRLLAKRPSLAIIAVLTLALGIGANVAIFSVLDPLLLRKLPVFNPDSLVFIDSAGTMGNAGISELSHFTIYRSQSEVFAGVLAFSSSASYEVGHNGTKSSARGVCVSGKYFEVLGVRPSVGRFLTPNDDSRSSENNVVISFNYWHRIFGSDGAAIGKVLTIENLPFTIVGIAPPEFFGAEVGDSPDFYISLAAAQAFKSKSGASDWVKIVGRLKPGVSLMQAQLRLEPTFQRIVREEIWLPQVEIRQIMGRLVLTSAARGVSEIREKFSLPARILMAVVLLVLLIACANVASLLFAHETARKREITIRLALGSTRLRLVRQLLTESSLLVAAGTVVGLFAALLSSKLLVAAITTQRVPIVLMTQFNGRILLFSALVASLSVLLCGFAPALSATRIDLAGDLKSKTVAGQVGSRGRFRLGSFLVITQVTLAVALLATSGLLLHSLANLETFDVGFNRDSILLVSMASDLSYSADHVKNFYDTVLQEVKRLPGIKSASVSGFAPISGRMNGINIEVIGYSSHAHDEKHAFFLYVTPDYFKTLGIPFLAGRDFSLSDNHNTTSVAIINRTMARGLFGQASPLGQEFKFVEGNKIKQIIGIVEDSKYNDLREDTPNFVYLTLLQASNSKIDGSLNILVNGPSANISDSLRRLINSIDKTVTINEIRTLREDIDESIHDDRVIAVLAGTFSTLALILTCIGLYGMLSFTVAHRTSEIGIRLALGANRRDIFRLIVRQGVQMTAAGMLSGAFAAWASTSFVKTMLFRVKQVDAVTLVGILSLLFLTTILACYVPARNAMRVDPLHALRYD